MKRAIWRGVSLGSFTLAITTALTPLIGMSGLWEAACQASALGLIGVFCSDRAGDLK